MKISEITQELILSQLRENAQALSAVDLAYIDALKEATIAYIKDWTGIGGVSEPDDYGRMLDDYEDLVYPFMTILSFMYDNRQMTVEKDKINPIAASTLNLHSFNLVPSEGFTEKPEVSI
ncbi:MAG: phage gp6-like head-tail connector protein [Lachnospiraceae bacterium]|nr:phage gp6-like head-tail connector protein [Lachnospiraceae bacterium]